MNRHSSLIEDVSMNPRSFGFDRSLAGARDFHAYDFDCPTWHFYDLGLRCCKPVTDKAGQHDDCEAMRSQERHGASAPLRPGQHFEHPSLLYTEAWRLRGRHHS